MPLMRPRRRLPGLALFALLALSSASAFGAPSFKEKAEARKLVQEAKKAMKDKRFADAEDALRRADELDPSAQTKLDRARALVEDKKLVEGSRVLHVLTDPTATDPRKNKRLVDAAKKMLGELEPRIPWLQVKVLGPPAGAATTRIDGSLVDASNETPIDPGEHKVEASAEGYSPTDKTVQLSEGAHESVLLELAKIPPPAPPPSANKGGSKVPAIVAFGLGAAGLGVGAAFGVMAFDKASDVKAQCVNNVCPPSTAGKLDSSRTDGTISTIGFIVGGVGVATGVVLLLVSSGSGKKSDEAPKAAASVTPWVGFGSAGLSGKF